MKVSHNISFQEALWVWARIALLSFGGPAGQIAVMHRILVEEKRWIGEQRFLHALNFCMLLPGPEAQQLATYIGWLLHRTRGGLAAGILFVLPGAVAIMILSWIYVLFGNVNAVALLFFGVKAAVLAVVFQAVQRIGGRALGNPYKKAVAIGAFVALFFFGVPFPVVILAAGLIGWWGQERFSGGGHGGGKGGLSDEESALGTEIPEHARRGGRETLKTAMILLGCWWIPQALLRLLLGPGNRFTEVGLFFSEMAVVTFGGAYAVLAYVGQISVETYHWLKPTEMLDGLGMAETTPGPLIMVTQFVGFLATYRSPLSLPPLLAGTLGGLLTTWVTFVPCFFWIFVGAPYIERLRENKKLSSALSAITAAVVGVVLNLSLWFSLHYLFRALRDYSWGPLKLSLPVWQSLDPWALLFSAAALVAVFERKWNPIWVIAGAALAGMLLELL